MTRRGVRAALGVIAALAGCAYYNAMWSAERFAKEARRLEARGQVGEARTQWARAATKAESVMVRHPRSRWADDALVLRAEGLARSGSCGMAAEPIAQARATVSEPPLRERAGLAAALCALAADRPIEAERALAEARQSDDDGRRSRAEYLAGQAAAARRDYDTAVRRFRRSREPGALPARVRALIAAGQPGEAAAVLDTVAAGRYPEAEWAELLSVLATEGGTAVASTALDRMLARGRIRYADEARLLIVDGDRRLAAGDHDGAVARYHAAAAAAPASAEAGVAQVRVLRVAAVRAAARADLAPVIAELEELSRPSGVPAARPLRDLLVRIAATPELPGAAFRAAELARDSLGAARLAGAVFLDLAAADPASLYAPKALVAALPLLPLRHDSIMGVLRTTYAASPYTRALRGEASPAYAAAEDSLARELGLALAQGGRRGGGAGEARFAPPVPGPRGPWLDGGPEGRRPTPGAAPAGRPLPAPRPDRPVAPERP